MKKKNSLLNFPRFVSYLFIPPLMNFMIFFYVAVKIEPNETKQIISVLISFLFGLLIPVVYFVIMRKKGRIDDDDANIRQQRKNPYLFGILLTIIAIALSSFLHLKIEIIALWVVYFINSLLLLIINKFWKISAHAMGVAIPMGITIFYSKMFTMILFIILILTGWSRIKLKVHTITQVVLGGILGFLVSGLIFQIFLLI